MKQIKIILSCEHAVNTIPPDYKHYFENYKHLLNTHRGLDIGALDLANYLSQSLKHPLICATVSRLVIDCNRSLKTCFSEITKAFSALEKNKIIEQYYLPFRQATEQLIQTNITQGYQVWHLSIHSFTPSLNGIVRHADIGLLYDPQRSNEQRLARTWQALLKQEAKHQVRLNYPYRGISDGFTTNLRKKYEAQAYIGIEIECNQKLTEQANTLAEISLLLAKTLTRLLTIGAQTINI